MATANLGLAQPDFNVATWHDDINNNFSIIDAAYGILSVQGEWLNSTAYDVSDRVVDITDGTIWVCAVMHTSASSGLFSADRTTNPTYWTELPETIALLALTDLDDVSYSTLGGAVLAVNQAEDGVAFTRIIRDVNDNEVLDVTGGTSSAVNYLDINNSAMSNAPELAAAGSDTNIALQLTSKGTGAIDLKVNGAIQISLEDGILLPETDNDIAIGSAAKRFTDFYLSGLEVVSGVLRPEANDGVTLGTASLSFADLFLADNGVINWANNSANITHINTSDSIFIVADPGNAVAASLIAFSVDGADRAYVSTTTLAPWTTNGLSLGEAGQLWSDLFLASGAVINFNADDVLITHSSNTLDITGLSSMGFNVFSATGASRGWRFIDDGTNAYLGSSADTDAAQRFHHIFYTTAGAVGSISTSISTTTFATTSDERLKEDFISEPDLLTILKQIKIYDFTWKTDSSKRSCGVIAQEIQSLVPNALIEGRGSPGEEGFIPWMTDYSKFVPYLIRSVQQLNSRVETLEQL